MAAPRAQSAERRAQGGERLLEVTMQIEMTVAGLTIDPVNNAPIVILREKESDRVLPIWIGVIEASAIAFELEKVKLARPMAHDLLRQAVVELGGHIDRVVVIDLRDNTYFANIVLSQNGRSITLDARPSDAIAVALRADAPILCEAKVIEQALARRNEAQQQQQAERAGPASARAKDEEDVDRGEGGPRPILSSGSSSPGDLLENLTPDAFGKYKM